MRIDKFKDYLPKVLFENLENNDLPVFLKELEDLFAAFQNGIFGSEHRLGIDELMNYEKKFLEAKENDEEDNNLEEMSFNRLKYLAKNINLPLRADKLFDWNYDFFVNSLLINDKRGTLEGLDKIIRLWLKGDLYEDQFNYNNEEVNVKLVSDFVCENAIPVETAFRLGDVSTVGLDTYLGLPENNFISILIEVNPKSESLKSLDGYKEFYEAVRFIIDNEKPANMYYHLRIIFYPMQLLANDKEKDKWSARIGKTTLLLDNTSIIDEYIYN